MTPANRDTLREGMARAEIEAKFGPDAVDLVFDPPVAATDKQRATFHARAEEARRHADQALTFLAPILDKADSADRMAGTEEEDDALAEARMEVAFKLVARAKAAEARADRLSAEVEALREALDDSQSLFAMINLVGPEREFWDAESIRTLLVEQIIHNRVCLNRTALARAAVKAETEGSDPLSPARKEDGDA